MPLTKKVPLETWIEDFIKSDDPRFQGKSRDERVRMAKGAHAAKMRESQILTFKQWMLSEANCQ